VHAGQHVGAVGRAAHPVVGARERAAREDQLVRVVGRIRRLHAHAGQDVPVADVDAGHQITGADVFVRVEVLLQRVLQTGAGVEDEAFGVIAEELLEPRQVQRGAETIITIEEAVGLRSTQTEVGQRESRAGVVLILTILRLLAIHDLRAGLPIRLMPRLRAVALHVQLSGDHILAFEIVAEAHAAAAPAPD
jgi:hypothetical protein